MEKTTALKKNREQIKLLADEIRLLKDEATLNKEQRKLTDLHTTLVRQGVIAAHPLDSGPSEGSDQGKGGGTLGAYGRMYPTLHCVAQLGNTSSLVIYKSRDTVFFQTSTAL